MADRAQERDFPVVYADVEPAVGVRAHPGLVGDRRSVTAVIRQRNEETLLALLTGGPFPALHAAPPPSPYPTPAPLRTSPTPPWTPEPSPRRPRSPPACRSASGPGARRRSP